MIITYFLSYIKFIDWFITCLYRYVVSFYLNYCSWYVIGCFTRNNLFVWLVNDYFLISSSLIDSLLVYIYLYFFNLNYCSWYVICCFTKSSYFVWFLNVYYITSSSLFDSLNAYFYILMSLYLIDCSLYFVGCSTRIDFYIWLWNGHHLFSSSLIDSLLALIFMYFFLPVYCCWYVCGCFTRNGLLVYLSFFSLSSCLDLNVFFLPF